MERFEHGGDIYGNAGITLDFSVNTNPLGMPEEVRSVLVSRVDEFTRYPDPQCRELCAAISRYEGIPHNWVLCGNGAADLIYRLCYAIKPHKALVYAPTFSEFERALEQAGCRVARHVLLPDNQFALTEDAADRLTPDIDIVFLCNPNNPTGRLIPNEVLERVLNRARKKGTKVIVDECFLDFTDGISCKRYLEEMPSLVVLKAFTKMYAIAGLRLGYMINADTELLEKVNAAAQCWSVSIPAQIAGTAALACAGWADKTRRLVETERRFLTEGMTALGITVFPADANYLLLRSEHPLYEALLKKGILIRSCENFIGLDAAYYRVGVKTRPENIRLLAALKEIVDG